MNTFELEPLSQFTLLGRAAESHDLVNILRNELVYMGKRGFTHLLVPQNGDRSVRVFLCEEIDEAVSFPSPLDAFRICRELDRFKKEARYPSLSDNLDDLSPEEQADIIMNTCTGWEIRRGTIKKKPAVIVIAARFSRQGSSHQ